LKLAIVIIHYNTSDDLGRCLESLAAYRPACDHQVIVVDNASQDAGLDDVHRRHPECLWIFNTENVGYAKGSNRGMAQVAADYYLILNPDIVVQPGGLDRLLDFADRHPRAGIVGPQLLNEDGSIQDSCRRFYTLGTLLMRRTILGKIFRDSRIERHHLMRDFDHQSNRPVDWMLGGCLLVRRSAMQRTGPMDERFFLYFEDVDWCYRMWQAGFEVQYTSEARFMHRHRRSSAGGTFTKSFWLHLGSLLSFYEKWGMLVWLLKKWREPLLVFLLWTLDMAGLTAAFAMAYGLRSVLGGYFAEPLYPWAEYNSLLLFALLLATMTFLLTGRYAPGNHRPGRSRRDHLQQVGIVSILLLASTYLGHLEVISRAVLLLFIPLFALLTGVGDLLFRALRRRLERGHFSLERTLLAGPPEQIRAWLAGAGDLTGQGIDVAGYLGDATAGGLPPLGEGQVPWLGSPADILAVVKRYRISQVVFWERPDPGDDAWKLLASLRRLRVRIRWHLTDVWLLTTGARPEFFGGDLSAIRGAGGGAAVRAVAGRLLSMAAGLLLGVVGAAPYLWLKTVRIPRGGSRLEQVQTSDLWGHDPEMTMAVTAAGRVLALPWQWPLAGSLLRGTVALFGPQPLTAGRVDAPRDPAGAMAFWKNEPRVPGLTGRWAARAEAPPWETAARSLWQLWCDPAGFGSLGVRRSQEADAKASRSQSR